MDNTDLVTNDAWCQSTIQQDTNEYVLLYPTNSTAQINLRPNVNPCEINVIHS